MENLRPPPLPSKSRIGKWRVFSLRAASSLVWGDGILLFHFILSKIEGLPSLIHTSFLFNFRLWSMIEQTTDNGFLSLVVFEISR